MSTFGRVVLVGGGKMGGALATGWLRGVLTTDEIIVVEPDDRVAEGLSRAGLPRVASADALPSEPPTAIVFAVKPQVMAGVLPLYRGFFGANTMAVSIAAGTPIRLFEDHLGTVPVVRAMPNTPAAIARGMTVACANDSVSAEQREKAERLLAAVGAVDWVDDETLMDAVTAVSGSGPAYVFLLVECLAKAGAEVGLPPALALRLARETVAGAGELARQSDDPPGQLRENVTSPGGTTEAALRVLMAPDAVPRLLTDAVRAATERGRELGR